MQGFIARENIKRFEAQLAECFDVSQRVTVDRLLATERQRQTITQQKGKQSAAMN